MHRLDAQAASRRLPQCTNPIAGKDVPVSRGAVVRVDRDVGVDEQQMARRAHEAYQCRYH